MNTNNMDMRCKGSFSKFSIILFLWCAQRTTEAYDMKNYKRDIYKILNISPSPFNLTKFAENREDADVGSEEIVYYISTRDGYDYKLIDANFTEVNPKMKIKFLVHGWTEHSDVVWCKNATEAYLRKDNFSVIAVDWSKIGDSNYLSASIASKSVGDRIGDWIIELTKKKNIPFKNFHLLSHSLGCQVAGFVGKRVFAMTGRKLARITACDPAAPIFDLFGPEGRLHRDDANFVDILHTDAGVLGFKYPIGTADFFPNGGSAIQPGCEFKEEIKYEDLFCSHAKSHHFFIETINANISEVTGAVPCSSWNDFMNGNCASAKGTFFGEAASSKQAGVFYMRTNPDGLIELERD